MTESPHQPQTTTITIRDGDERDAAAVMAIYNHEVLNGTATLDLQTRTITAQQEWMREHQGATPVIVAEHGGEVVGFASLTPFKERAAYRTTVENSVYVRPASQGLGIGTRLLGEIIDRARRLGYHSVIARITGDNAGSIALHHRFGFELVGVEREIGRKFGQWLDVTELQLLLDSSSRTD